MKYVIKFALLDAGLSAGQITAMGISTQRGTFTTWSKDTGEHFHNFVTWKDLRADELVKQWNESYIWRVGENKLNLSLTEMYCFLHPLKKSLL